MTDQCDARESSMERDVGTIVVVIGGGTTGTGIAQVLLEAGVSVHLTEADQTAADAARIRIVSGLSLSYKRADDPNGRTEADLDRLTMIAELPTDVLPELVIEAVPEVREIKISVLVPASETWSDAVIATNTSSLSVAILARSIQGPHRFIGMHFFNPVPRSALVELVVGQETDPATTAKAQSWIERLGKESIAVRDTPGFATSRFGVVLGLEAIRMVEEGVASASDIDKGMKLGYRFPMGPLELTDLVGLDVRLAIAEHLAGELGPRFEPPALLREKVGRGELGKKSGRGFYDWADHRSLVSLDPREGCRPRGGHSCGDGASREPFV